MKSPGLAAIVTGFALLTPRALHTPTAVRLAAAIRAGNVARVDAQLRRGADPNVRLENGETPLALAILSEHPRVSELLVARGADPNISANGLSMLSLLVQTRPCPVGTVLALLRAGADPNSRDAPSDRTPLLRALNSGAAACAEILLNHGANIDARDKGGSGALDAAVVGSSPEMVERLIQRGVAIDATTDRQVTALMWAALRRPDAKGDAESVIAVLLRHGADPCMKDAGGMTAADYAQKMGFADRAARLAVACVNRARQDPRGSSH
ncbi:MAG: ankyrin repeat domain-containing protein [Gammaproteobacteria bacterium]|nr:ankyrin repeat domain-containing protein [Gammaproteobacteria bacterium]